MRTRTPLITCALAVFAMATMVTGQTSAARGTRASAASAGNGQANSDWPMYGRDLAGSHYNPNEKQITPATVSRLKPKWVFDVGADVSSQPTVVNGIIYFGSWDGKEYAVDAKTGKKLWEFETGYPSRSGAAYVDGMLYFGDAGGRLFALDAKTGQKVWQVKVDPHPMNICTS